MFSKFWVREAKTNILYFRIHGKYICHRTPEGRKHNLVVLWPVWVKIMKKLQDIWTKMYKHYHSLQPKNVIESRKVYLRSHGNL